MSMNSSNCLEFCLGIEIAQIYTILSYEKIYNSWNRNPVATCNLTNAAVKIKHSTRYIDDR